mmetsp:Transcript_9456/g.31278  ORF Transcript_9456/g.31278 Transcript_9456/m.31278 type:complete len:205 (+) Transcript_9456:401-1015(+)
MGRPLQRRRRGGETAQLLRDERLVRGAARSADGAQAALRRRQQRLARPEARQLAAQVGEERDGADGEGNEVEQGGLALHAVDGEVVHVGGERARKAGEVAGRRGAPVAEGRGRAAQREVAAGGEGEEEAGHDDVPEAEHRVVSSRRVAPRDHQQHRHPLAVVPLARPVGEDGVARLAGGGDGHHDGLVEEERREKDHEDVVQEH